MYLGMSQAQADAGTSWRGTDQGTQMKSGGGSGLVLPFGGGRNTSGVFYDSPAYADLWSSSESGVNAWRRGVGSSFTTIWRDAFGKTNGFSVRCIGN